MFLLGAFKSLGFLRKQKELTSTNNKLNAKIMELEKKISELEVEQEKENMDEQEQILVSGSSLSNRKHAWLLFDWRQYCGIKENLADKGKKQRQNRVSS